MKWKQLFKNALITTIGAPIFFWVLQQLLGDTTPVPIQTYGMVGIAAAIGATIGEVLRQKNRK